MKEHFEKSAEMKLALIRGNLDAAKKSAQWMAEHSLTPDLPVNWKPHVEGLQDAARQGRDAKDLKAASAAFGAIGRACAVCHEQLGGPKIALGTPPAEGSGAALHMVRHQWAMDRMWEGLMAPSEEAWVKGAEVMADAPLAPEAISGQKSVAPETVALATTAHTIANRARTTETKERGAAYGELLVTCSACHSKLAVSPK
jgi:cytochrome c556